MKLKPFNESEEAAVVKDAVAALFNGERKTQKLEMEEIRDLFTESGAGIQDIAKMCGNIIRAGEEDGLKLKAGELAMKVHGILKEMESKGGLTININVVGEGNNAMINLLCPT